MTNELLKLIPAFRQHDERLLVCATNSVRSLDSAFLRPGRFDYIIPVGPPDTIARVAIWRRYLGAMTDYVEVDKLVEASAMFTPADIEFAARKGAQCAFEREVEFRRGEPVHTGRSCHGRHCTRVRHRHHRRKQRHRRGDRTKPGRARGPPDSSARAGPTGWRRSPSCCARTVPTWYGRDGRHSECGPGPGRCRRRLTGSGGSTCW